MRDKVLITSVGELSGPLYSIALDSHLKEFQERFERTFGLQDKGS